MQYAHFRIFHRPGNSPPKGLTNRGKYLANRLAKYLRDGPNARDSSLKLNCYLNRAQQGEALYLEYVAIVLGLFRLSSLIERELNLA